MTSREKHTPRPGLDLFWTKSWTLSLVILLVAFGAAMSLDLIGDHDHSAGFDKFREFFSKALSPTLISENEQASDLLPELKEGAQRTILVAFAAMSLAIIGGFILGCLASEAFWSTDPVTMHDPWQRFRRRVLRPFILNGLRVAMGFTRSIHEIFWALLGIALFGLSVTCGILAIALPYAATLGRIYAELIDETERGAADALRDCGANNLAVFSFGLLPRAASGMLSYTFYRFDCAIRSSAILGFIGFPTLGLSIRNAVKYGYYRQAWTSLYVLFFILIVTEFTSGVFRKRIAAWR